MEYFYAFLTFSGLMLVIALAYAATRYIATKSVGMTQGKYIRLVDSLSLGRERGVFIIEVGGSFLLLSNSAQGIEPIAELNGAKLIPLEKKPQAIDFRSILKGRLMPSKNAEEPVEKGSLEIVRDKIRASMDTFSRKKEK